ncbi:MAG TPA: hypothetical protein VHT75_18005 [Acidimicrobiales bacterium]|nr:hypothetical protein [Acidimicrobiales bacterium]
MFLPLALVLLMPASARAASNSSRTPSVDAAVQVTADPDPARGYVMPRVAADPKDPSVVATIDGNAPSGGCRVQVSHDAGLSWTQASNFAPSDFPKCVWSTLGSFAAITFGPDGSLNVAFTGQPDLNWHSKIFFARSPDLGATWSTTVLPKQDPDYAHGSVGSTTASDVVVDPNNANRVYVGYWANFNNWIHKSELPIPAGKDDFTGFPGRAMVAVSNDGGKTFADPVDVHGNPNAWLTEPHMAVGNDGTLYAFYGDDVESGHVGGDWAYPTPPVGHVWMATSTDHGKTYSKPVALYSRGPASGWAWTQAAIPVVDRQSGNIYLTWEATGAGPDGGEKTSAVPAVKFMRSVDKGKTWSTPVVINDVQPKRTWACCTFEPNMSIAPNGRIDVAFYDYRDDPYFDPTADGDKQDRVENVYYSYSNDGGRTWSPNMRVSDRGIDRSFGPTSGNYGVKGPLGITSTNNAAMIAWDDTRNGSVAVPSEDIYFTQARFSNSVIPATSTPSNNHTLLWSLASAAAALGLAGLVLLAIRWARRAPKAEHGAPTATA